jgi:hypothetical protein
MLFRASPNTLHQNDEPSNYVKSSLFTQLVTGRNTNILPVKGDLALYKHGFPHNTCSTEIFSQSLHRATNIRILPYYLCLVTGYVHSWNKIFFEGSLSESLGRPSEQCDNYRSTRKMIYNNICKGGGGRFICLRKRLWFCVDILTPSSAEVEWVELYLYSLHMPTWYWSGLNLSIYIYISLFFLARQPPSGPWPPHSRGF